MDSNIKLTTIYVTRHGETEANTKRLLYGHSETDLTKKGVEDTQVLAEKLKDVHFDAVFSSDLLRAVKTAEILKLERKILIETTEVLRERYFGKYEKESFEKLMHDLKDDWDRYEKLTDSEKFKFKFPDHPEIESDEELIARLIVFLREVAVGYQGRTVLVVCHGGIMRALLTHLGYGTYAEITPTSVKNNAFIKLESDGVDFFIKEVDGIVQKSPNK